MTDWNAVWSGILIAILLFAFGLVEALVSTSSVIVPLTFGLVGVAIIGWLFALGREYTTSRSKAKRS